MTSFRDLAGHAAKNIAGDSPWDGEMLNAVKQRGRRVHVRHSLFSLIRVFVDVQRQLCNCFRKHPHTGVNSNLLHCRAVVDALSGSASAEKVGVAGAVVAVGRLVLAFE